MKVEEWKQLTEHDRNDLLSNHEKFNAYSDGAYQLVRDLGIELAGIENTLLDKVGVANRWGSLVIQLYLPDEKVERIKELNKNKKYYGFMVMCSRESAWIDQ